MENRQLTYMYDLLTDYILTALDLGAITEEEAKLIMNTASERYDNRLIV